MGERRPLLDRVAIAVHGRAAAHPRWAASLALVPLVIVPALLPRPGGRPAAEVFARDTYRFALDALGIRLVEGHADLLHAAAREAGVSATLLAAIVYAESRGRGGQTSSAGALGLGQLSPAAAADAARRLGLEVPPDEAVRDDDALNLRLAATHLRWLLDNSEGWPLEQVLVSYNAGRARMFQWLERAGGWPAWIQGEERAAARGEATTGSLRYARDVLEVRERLRARGAIRDDPGAG